MIFKNYCTGLSNLRWATNRAWQLKGIKQDWSVLFSFNASASSLSDVHLTVIVVISILQLDGSFQSQIHAHLCTDEIQAWSLRNLCPWVLMRTGSIMTNNRTRAFENHRYRGFIRGALHCSMSAKKKRKVATLSTEVLW